MRRLLSIAILLLTAAFGAMPEAAADCTCRAGGRDYALGSSICLPTPAGLRLAVCGMVVNNTSWQVSAAPCVGVRLDQPARETRVTRHTPLWPRPGG